MEHLNRSVKVIVMPTRDVFILVDEYLKPVHGVPPFITARGVVTDYEALQRLMDMERYQLQDKLKEQGDKNYVDGN